MLRIVRNRFIAAYGIAQKPIPVGAFVQVWNLFYLCSPKLDLAISAIRGLMPPLPLCSTASMAAPIVWFAWGGSDPFLNSFKGRFLKRIGPVSHSFFYDKNTKCVKAWAPTANDFAKHPQGLPAAPIDTFLATIV
jgi:hypothetical protein